MNPIPRQDRLLAAGLALALPSVVLALVVHQQSKRIEAKTRAAAVQNAQLFQDGARTARATRCPAASTARTRST